MATSAAQTLPAVEVYGYLYNDDGTPAVNKQVWLKLSVAEGTPLNCTNPIVTLSRVPLYSTRTDPNGFWHITTVVPNDRINPANTVYERTDELGGNYQVTLPLAGAPGIGWLDENAKVTQPASLSPAGQTVGALTASSLTDSGLTAGEVVFAGVAGLLSGDPNLFWDNTNKRLGIGTASPSAPLHVVGHVVSAGAAPTLGALQTGVANQSIGGTDTRPTVTITTTGTPPGANAALCQVVYASAYAAVPNSTWTSSGPTVLALGNNSPAAGSVFVLTQSAAGASNTYLLMGVVLG